jgi:hypothetical protein
MGWSFREGITRERLIEQRTRGWKHMREDGVTVTATCLAHCHRQAVFCGVLWSVWERRFEKDGAEAEPPRRWIACDLLRHEPGLGWGYRDTSEACGPAYYSCPLAYFDLVPIDRHGGNADWREQVREHAWHEEQRRSRRLSGSRRRRPATEPSGQLHHKDERREL